MASRGFCYNCNMAGHFARDCPYRQPSLPQQPSGFRVPFPPPPHSSPLASPSLSRAPFLALPPPPPSPTSQPNGSQALVLRQPLWKLNQDKLDRVYEFMASELEVRQEAIRERERLLKEEAEKKKIKDAEDKALRKLKERQDFEERIGTIVGTKINDACELFLGKVDLNRMAGERKTSAEHARPRIDEEAEKECLRKQIEQLRIENEWIKKNMKELSRTIKQSVADTKRTGAGVCITSPPEAPARGRPRLMGVGTPTSQDFQKLLRACNSIKEGKRAVDMEVQMLKERFERAIGKLVRQGRTPRSNLSKRINEVSDDDEPENLGKQDDALDDITLRPSPPKRTSRRLATKVAATERADFIKETKRHLKRLKKNGLQILCGREGISFTTCEQAINYIAEHRAALAFDFRPEAFKVGRSAPESEADEAKEDVHDDGQATQPVDIDDEEHLAEE
ncbi:hypothetical protein CBR_g22415 [Chara braunii]|uniref:CCHC-type domain-containing protein n=1 Tax=Chara braunii TaxID=69332 RepID=A0A388JUZ3_CHABU|nr:hypothetical protein CBR_g22415 [Chara braunii]|eukprot:GBG61618.1 hypothetical protein CBR_g22415 [Chara braunii]